MGEKKKVEKQEVKKLEPKKRIPIENKPIEKPKQVSVIDVNIEPESEKRTRSENKYIRIQLGASSEEKNKFSEKIKKGDIKFAFYGVDGEKGYFYYVVNKK